VVTYRIDLEKQYLQIFLLFAIVSHISGPRRRDGIPACQAGSHVCLDSTQSEFAIRRWLTSIGNAGTVFSPPKLLFWTHTTARSSLE
jgi:hypothetical protein